MCENCEHYQPVKTASDQTRILILAATIWYSVAAFFTGLTWLGTQHHGELYNRYSAVWGGLFTLVFKTTQVHLWLGLLGALIGALSAIAVIKIVRWTTTEKLTFVFLYSGFWHFWGICAAFYDV
jgi:hypothetical protein